MSLSELWLDAIGHMHPIVLHFPIALGAAAALVEVIAWLLRRPAPSPSALTLLWLAALTGPLAAASGWFLADTQGDSSSTLDWHRWTGVASAVALFGVAIMATALRRRPGSFASVERSNATGSGVGTGTGSGAGSGSGSGVGTGTVIAGGTERNADGTAPLGLPAQRRVVKVRIYRLCVIAVAALVGLCGHFGGEMKWGEGFTTRALFTAVGATFGGGATPTPPSTPTPRQTQTPTQTPTSTPTPTNAPLAPSPSEMTADELRFDPHIHAIFLERCTECHLGGRRKGRLSLVSRELVVRDNDDGQSIVKPGADDESELLRRVLLPEGDESAMPPEGPRLSEVQINLIRQWIKAGAP